MKINNFVNGRELDPASGAFEENFAPATGETLAEVAVSGESDVQAAYEAARNAQPAWAALSVPERNAMIRGWANAVKQHVDELSLLDARDNGSPRRTMRAGTLKGAAYADFFCGIAYEIKGETFPATAANLHYTRREPYGVVSVIIPFNHPAFFAVSKTSPALVAGNTVIFETLRANADDRASHRGNQQRPSAARCFQRDTWAGPQLGARWCRILTSGASSLRAAWQPGWPLWRAQPKADG